jgi:hypothetical protein
MAPIHIYTSIFLLLRVATEFWHRECINEYSEISQSIYDRIAEYRTDGLSDDQIEEKMSRELHMGTDLIKFIIKNKK